jgi:hypothetical protein
MGHQLHVVSGSTMKMETKAAIEDNNELLSFPHSIRYRRGEGIAGNYFVGNV